MIEPTVGRIVWYYESRSDHEQAAIVTRVHGPRMIDITVFGPGQPVRALTSIQLVQDDDERGNYGFCTWMPYQKGQAAKTEALEKNLGKTNDQP